MPSYTFPKSERLSSRSAIKELFSTANKHIFAYPFKLLYLTQEQATTEYPQVVISVSKRIFRNASDRNRVKRLVREAYRLQKPELMPIPNTLQYLAIIYIGKEIEEYAKVEKGMKKVLKKLREEVAA